MNNPTGHDSSGINNGHWQWTTTRAALSEPNIESWSQSLSHSPVPNYSEPTSKKDAKGSQSRNNYFREYHRYRKEQKDDLLERLIRIESYMEDMNKRMCEVQLKIENVFMILARGNLSYSEGRVESGWNQDPGSLNQHPYQQSHS